MSKDLIETYKHELKCYRSYANMLESLKEKLDEAYYELAGVKAIRYDKAPSMPNKHLIDMRKHELSEKIEKLEKQVNRLSAEIEYMELVLANMQDHEIRKAIIDIYINGNTYIEVCEDLYITPAGLLYQINKCIKNALEITLGN